MTLDCKQLLIGGLIGGALVAFAQTQTFRKGCAKVVAAGLQLKDDASEFLESVNSSASVMKAAFIGNLLAESDELNNIRNWPNAVPPVSISSIS